MQFPEQAVGPQVYGEQLWSCSGGQEPAPSQLAASTATPLLHDGLRQLAPLPGYAQAAGCVPSQAPPQTEPSDTQGARPVRGTPATAVQVPTLPDSPHASHWPLQALSQQTPSTQCPDAHWFAPPQVCPCVSSGTQTPAEHQLPLVQSESALQLPAHAVGPQENGVQSCVCSAGHDPAPSQDAESVAVVPAQEAARQDTELPGKVQDAVCVPSQLPAQRVPSEAQGPRVPCGAPEAGEHVPSLPETSQASHCPPQARSQQYPSTHGPALHS
jgi:hypothetical protein